MTANPVSSQQGYPHFDHGAGSSPRKGAILLFKEEGKQTPTPRQKTERNGCSPGRPSTCMTDKSYETAIRDEIVTQVVPRPTGSTDGYYQLVFCPLLTFEYTGVAELANVLRRIKDDDDTLRYDALVITSPRAVHALDLALQEISEAQELVNHLSEKLTIYSVGKKTASGLRKANLGNSCKGEECGNAESLVDVIYSDFDHRLDTQLPPSLLFLCGEKHRDTIPSVQEKGFLLDKLVVYRSAKRSSSDVIHQLSREQVIEYEPGQQRPIWKKNLPITICLFSPSGLEALQQSKLLPSCDDPVFVPKELSLIAIGPTTKRAIEDYGLSCTDTANEPSASGVASALRRSLTKYESP